jgi:hypothetical protein
MGFNLLKTKNFGDAKTFKVGVSFGVAKREHLIDAYKRLAIAAGSCFLFAQRRGEQQKLAIVFCPNPPDKGRP